MKKYIIIWAYSLVDLEKEVNEKIVEGYSPQGGVSAMMVEWENVRKGYEERELYYHQAMMKVPALTLHRKD